ncbi:MAG TPA: hypothetical protein PKC14_03925 [Candidatus Absconditabacterales bacterium]|nr:hypothetical protein [Candidatus Absconditabacterales bacterium]
MTEKEQEFSVVSEADLQGIKEKEERAQKVTGLLAGIDGDEQAELLQYIKKVVVSGGDDDDEDLKALKQNH